MKKPLLISDTGPLNYLVQLGEVNLLERLFGSVIVPVSVIIELEHERSPLKVKQWSEDLPSWVKVAEPIEKEASVLSDRCELLGKGEQAAIWQALETGGDILMDDREARQVAEGLGITVFGTLAVLKAAAVRGWLDFSEAAERLVELGCFLSQELITSIETEIESG